MPQGMQVIDGHAHALGVVYGHGGVEPLVVRHVDADQRHAHALQVGDLLHGYVERGHDHRVDIAAQGQLVEERHALFGVRNAVEGHVVAMGLQHLGQPLVQIGVEPGGDRLAGEHSDTERVLRFQRGGGPGDGEVEFVGRFDHFLARGLGDDIRFGECS